MRGSLSVFAPRGQYNLVVTKVTEMGTGNLHRKFELLKTRLRAEGLFETSAQQPLPDLPRGIGIATAEGSAALADMRSGLERRFPLLPVMLASCRVQGHGAAEEIVAAIEHLDRQPSVDLIIIARGGGSLEDLWAFNEEIVIRAIAACQTPVISAVGHETDTTLADFAADQRAKTPTAAIEEYIPDFHQLNHQVDNLRQRLDAAIDRRLNHLRLKLDHLVDHQAFLGPAISYSSDDSNYTYAYNTYMVRCNDALPTHNIATLLSQALTRPAIEQRVQQSRDRLDSQEHQCYLLLNIA